MPLSCDSGILDCRCCFVFAMIPFGFAMILAVLNAYTIVLTMILASLSANTAVFTVIPFVS